MSIHVLVTFMVVPSKLEAFRGLLETVKRELPKVAGCEGVRVFGASDAPLELTLLETWASREAHRAHVDHLVSTGAWAHVAEHLAKEAATTYVTEL